MKKIKVSKTDKILTKFFILPLSIIVLVMGLLFLTKTWTVYDNSILNETKLGLICVIISISCLVLSIFALSEKTNKTNRF